MLCVECENMSTLVAKALGSPLSERLLGKGLPGGVEGCRTLSFLNYLKCIQSLNLKCPCNLPLKIKEPEILPT